MLRAASVAIALTLAIGQDAALMCTLWCVQHPVAAAGCQHGDPAPSSRVAAGDDCCAAAVVAVAAILPRDARACVTAPDGEIAIPIRFLLTVRHVALARPGDLPGRRRSADARLLSALRI